MRFWQRLSLANSSRKPRWSLEPGTWCSRSWETTKRCSVSKSWSSWQKSARQESNSFWMLVLASLSVRSSLGWRTLWHVWKCSQKDLARSSSLRHCCWVGTYRWSSTSSSNLSLRRRAVLAWPKSCLKRLNRWTMRALTNSIRWLPTKSWKYWRCCEPLWLMKLNYIK